MHDEKIHLERIKRFIARIKPLVHPEKVDLAAEYIYNQEAPIPFDEIADYTFKPISKSEVCGKTWGSG